MLRLRLGLTNRAYGSSRILNVQGVRKQDRLDTAYTIAAQYRRKNTFHDRAIGTNRNIEYKSGFKYPGRQWVKIDTDRFFLKFSFSL